MLNVFTTCRHSEQTSTNLVCIRTVISKQINVTGDVHQMWGNGTSAENLILPGRGTCIIDIANSMYDPHEAIAL